MIGDIIYEAEGKIISKRIVSLDPITYEGNYVADGMLRNGMAIKEHCTYISIRKSKDKVYGEGKHVLITSDNHAITWIGRGFGLTLKDKQIWRGSGIFSSELKEFDDIIGMVEAEIINDKIRIKVWEWK